MSTNKEGYRAYYMGYKLWECPYNDIELAESWENGWMLAEKDDMLAKLD